MATEREDGQMLLLGAVVLVIAFLALGLMVARLGTLEQETTRDETGPFLRQWDAVLRGAEAAANATDTLNQTVSVLDQRLDGMESYLLAKGYILEASARACVSGDPILVDLAFSDGSGQVSVLGHDTGARCT